MDRYLNLTPSRQLTWLLNDWPQGDFELTLNLVAGKHSRNGPAIVVDLESKILLDFIGLSPIGQKPNQKGIVFVPEDNGLLVWIENDSFILFRTHGNIIPRRLAIVELFEDPHQPQYAGVIPFETRLHW